MSFMRLETGGFCAEPILWSMNRFQMHQSRFRLRKKADLPVFGERLTGALTGALAGFELCLAPYAAETVIAASAPFGMSIFGQFVSAGALVDLTASGFFAITGANTLFKLTNAIEQVSGVNWMKSMGMSDESYSSYEEFSDLMSLQIGFWGMMNPRLWEKPKDPPGKITQSAGYQNPETYGYGHHYTKNKVKGRNCSI